VGAESDARVRCAAVRLSGWRNFALSNPLIAALRRPRGGDARHTSNALVAPGEESWTRQKYNSFHELSHNRDEAPPSGDAGLASLIQDALRRRTELAAYARREIYRELATYLQSEISPFPDELVEMLSDEQYFD